MKRTLLAVGVIVSLISGSSMAKEFVLIDQAKGMTAGNWQVTERDLAVSDNLTFSVKNQILHGGKQEGSQRITIRSGDFAINLSPTRGMGILSVVGNGVRLGWDSPVDEVVNPAFINLDSRGGLGWLEGFNEMMVRCGFEWTGHPVIADGTIYSLHGRAGNTPVSQLIVDIEDQPPYTITVKGLIKENTFKKGHLETWASLSYVPGTNSFTVHDILTNRGDYPRDYQIIYHSNFGPPLLEQDAQFIAPVKAISPFNDYAKQGLDSWQSYLGPTNGFDEMVFNIYPYADAQGQTQVMLTNKAGDKGAGIAFNINQLPVLSLWKNTDTLKQGYVTGLEPGTSFAYPVTIEREQSRVRQLAPGQSTAFTLTYSLLADKTAVDRYQAQIRAIQGDRQTEVIAQPLAEE
ncbi:aldose 1-epimerase family protein [Utexia brackfieldae]|uniref:aldose 1-epimerase family protein n=1 Tax=Utexia brackfieldae TaxID=3074108 RepID=UPI00370D2AFD